MAAIDVFNTAWARADHVGAAHAFLAANATQALQVEELLRAEWAARVSALDLYVHEVVAEKMLEILRGARPSAASSQKFQLGCDILLMGSAHPNFASAADLAIRARIERQTFQLPDDIAEAVRHISDCELWNEVAVKRGATPQTKAAGAKAIKRQLTQIVNRRNKIVHEADLQPGIPRTPWPISTADLTVVRDFVRTTVVEIDEIIG